MNKVNYLLLSFLFLSVMANAQTFQWAKRLSGSGSFDVNVKKVAANSSDGVYVCGSFTGTVDFEPGSPTVNKTANGTDGFVAKYDEGGNLLWVFTTDSTGSEEISCITSTSTRVTAVERKGTNSFRVRQLNSATGVPTVQSSYFISYNATVTPEAVTINAVNSSICVVGSFDGLLLVGTYTHGTAGLSDMFYMNLAANANSIGVNTFVRNGGPGNDFAHDIVSLSSGVMYMAGSLSGTVDFLDVQNVAFSVTSAGGTDAILTAIDISGEIPRADNVMRIGGSNDDEFLSVTAGANSTNEVIVAGYFTGTVDFNAKSAVNTLVSAGGKDGCVAKYTYTNQGGGSAFDYGWANKLGGTADDRAICVSQFSNIGNVYFSAALGSSTGTAVQVGGYSSTGTNVTFGGLFLPANQTTLNVPRSIKALSTGEVYTSGIFNASTDFDPSTNTVTIAPVSGGNNGFVHKMGGCAPAAAPTITASRDTVCAAFNDTLRVTGSLAGNNKWVWYRGSCGGTYVDTGAVIVVAPSANTTYYVRGEGGCAGTGACSAAKTITAIAPVTPIVTTVGPVSVCSGEQVFYSVTITGLTAPFTYQWRKNGTNVSGATNSVYYPSSIANNDVFSCIVTGISNCGTIATATSSSVTVTVTQSAVPVVTIAIPNPTACSNTNVTFTSSITNGGSTPTYQWLRNNVPISGATSATLVINSLNLGSTVNITCVLTSSLSCASPSKDTSNVLSVSIIQSVTPSISITPSATTICSTGSVTFTSSISNGGNAQAYTWQKNGVTISGATSSTYTASSVNNGDVFRCILLSNAQCANPATDTSNAIAIAITAPVTPSVAVSASSTNICAGTSVTFTATPTNGGTTPTYQWRRNGANISGATSSTYTTTTLANNDVITCVLTTSLSCFTVATATSNSVTITVSSSVVPVVSVSASSTTVCAGTSITLTATPVSGGGNAPTYQWVKNGNNISGATSATYIASGLAANDVFSCIMTSNATCAVPTTATSNTVVINVIPVVVPSVQIGTGNTTVCAGSSVTFVATTVNAGSSPTYTWKRNGVTQAGNTSPYTFSSLNNGDVISCDLTSSTQCASPATVTSNAITMTVLSQVNAGISIAATQTTVCTGNSVTFTATPVNGGGNPVYQWKKNGIAISGATSATYTTSTLANGDNFTCDVTSNAACINTTTATSNTITISVSSSVTPAVIISTANTTVCAGASVTFSVTPTNGGSSPTYQWRKNGSNISGATGATYTTSGLANNDAITCVLTSSVACASPSTATSNTLLITVNPAVVPSVSIATPNTTICAGSSITFTATPVNGGTNPTYIWRENGVDQGSTAATYTVPNIANGTVVSCALQSTAACASPVTATSNNITVTVNPQLSPAISITASQTTICAGGSVTFTATPANGGSTPTYQWKKNGSNISGATSATYSASSIANGDVFTCQLTSNAACLATNNVTSNSITISVGSSVTPSVVISTSGATTVCAGTTVNFTAVPTNGGNSPTYQWTKNGVNISGATAATYSTSNIQNNDVFRCVLTSSVSCASPSTVNSNTISIAVNPVITPSITISTANTTICSGSAVTVAAAAVNGGNAPQYIWTENGFTQGETSNTYTTSGLQGNTTISCELVSNAVCATTTNATSNTLNVTVTPRVTPQVSIAVSEDSVCQGTVVTFTATPVNGGTQPAYQWYKNGSALTGETLSTYSTGSLLSSDVITCELTTSLTCVTGTTAQSNGISILLYNSLVPSINVYTNATTICEGQSVTFETATTNGGNNPVYQWRKNGVDVAGANSSTYTTSTLADGDAISCVLTSSYQCASPQSATSNTLTIDVTPLFVPTVSITPTADTICSTGSVTYTASAIGVVSSYQWTINSINAVLGNSVAFTPINVNDGDTIRCVITSAESCANPAQAISQPHIITVLTPVNLEVEIATAQSTTCTGSVVIFTSTVSNGGDNPQYQWSVNGSEVNGATGMSYTSSAFSDGDVVSCVVTASEQCVANSQALSNNVTINVVSSLTASVNISADQGVICQGSLGGFTATGVNGGASATYMWSVNGVEILLGSGSDHIFIDNLNNNDTVRCKLISSESCVVQAEVLSDPLVVTVNALPNVTITTTGSTLSVQSSDTYQWYNCNGNAPISGATSSFYTATGNGAYKVVVADVAGCVDTSECVNVTVIGIDDIAVDILHVYPNPFTGSVIITAPEFDNGYAIQVYNCIGAVVKNEVSHVANYSLDLSELLSGVYILKVSNGKHTYLRRIQRL